MKQLKISELLFIIIILSLSSCLKKDAANVDIEETTGSIVTLEFIEGGSGSTINSGMQYFSGGALTYAASSTSDTAHISVKVAGTSAPANDVQVTIGLKADAILDNYKSDSIDYELMPDSLYKISTTSVTIKAGSRVAPLEVVFYPSKIDPSKSYMLPLVVTGAGGIPISSNFGIIYFHVIGNPLAGTYVMTGSRYNFIGSVAWVPGDPVPPAGYTGITAYAGDIIAAPVNSKTIQLVMGNVPDPGPNGGSAVYLITGINNFADITYGFASTFTAGYSNIIKYVAAYTPPSATQKASFHLITKYNNTTGNGGNDRLIDQTFIHK